MSTEPASSARHASGQAGPSGARGQPAGLRGERPLFPGSGRARFSVRSWGAGDAVPAPQGAGRKRLPEGERACLRRMASAPVRRRAEATASRPWRCRPGTAVQSPFPPRRPLQPRPNPETLRGRGVAASLPALASVSPLLWGWQIGANPALLVCRGSEEMLFSEILVLGKQGGGM